MKVALAQSIHLGFTGYVLVIGPRGVEHVTVSYIFIPEKTGTEQQYVFRTGVYTTYFQPDIFKALFAGRLKP